MTDKHDTNTIGTHHPDGSKREVMAYVNGLQYARGDFRETLSAVGSNPDLQVDSLTLAIDAPRPDDRRHLCFGQAVTLEEIRGIVRREDAKLDADLERSMADW